MNGALGNALFLVSQSVFSWGQVALDLSHIGTFVAAFFGGPTAGVVSGAIVGLTPGLYFGFMTPGGGLGTLGLIGLPAGKALTGLASGLLVSRLKLYERRYRSFTTLIAVPLSYLPEFFFTLFFFLVLLPVFLPSTAQFLLAALVPIMVKAWIEIGLIGFYMAALVGNQGFSSYMRRLAANSSRLRLP